MAKAKDQLVWIDMEMSGLNPDTDVVLEVSVLLTNANLEITAEGPDLILGQPAELFASMDNWNQEHHTKSGLWAAVQTSTVTLKEAEDQLMAFLEQHIAPKSSPLCGNSIAQDRLFLRKYMPRVHDYLHYRMVDVSSIKELVKRWYPERPAAPAKVGNHRALDDIKESITELRFYRETFFTKPI
ncbi:MAG: oligoribonuclease [Bdellovibrionota bacterium]